MGSRIAAALVLTSGCSAVFGLDSPDHAPADAAADTQRMLDSTDACASTSTLLDTCTQSYGSQNLTIDAIVTFDSDTRMFSTNGPTAVITDGPIVVISAPMIAITKNGALRLTGSKPIVLAARDLITIDGIIVTDASGHSCNAAPGQDDNGGGGGGAGGGFAGEGGAGGMGDSDGAMASNGGATSPAVPRPATLLGGCAGGKGGNATGIGGAGGYGGGALGLVAPHIVIQSDAQLEAGGGGGHGGTTEAGGGGGGSGGMIVLDGTTIEIMGKLAANGGGGGEGAGNNPGNAGSLGLMSTLRAQGGQNNANQGGDGGDGGAGTTLDGLPSTQFLPSGGGGGGGGAGFVAMTSTPSVASGSVISPTYGTWP